ncbi:type III effector protein, partial [Streptomyces albidoflavus]
AHDDPAALLGPLREAASPLRSAHPELAGRIDDLSGPDGTAASGRS